MKNTTFKFLPNGTPVTAFKNKVKRLSKEQKLGLSATQNKLSKQMFNKPYNKLSDEIETHSPILSENILYVPLIIDRKHIDGEEGSFCYYVAINNSTIALSLDLQIDISDYITSDWVNDVKLSDFEILKNHNGWLIKLPNNHILFIHTGDEGLCVDFAYDHEDEYEALESSYIFWNEMISLYELAHLMDKPLCEYRAAEAFNHTDEMESTLLMTVGSIDLKFYGSFTVSFSEDGEDLVYTPRNAFDMARRKGVEKEFSLWLQGKHYDMFNSWKKESSVYFGLENNEDGSPVGEVFDYLPRTIAQKMLIISEYFLES